MKNRRTFLKTAATAAAGLSVAPAFSFSIINKPRPVDDLIIGHGEYRYKVYKDWAKISAVHNPLLNCHEMVQDQKGRLLMIGDHTANNILVFDKSGKLLDYWGTQYPGGHGLTLTNEGGEDFLFIVDCGYYTDKTGQGRAQAGQVVKTTIDGNVVFNIGHPRTIGIYKDDERFQPTEVAVAPNGDFYVADGYGSDYIIQYNHHGEYIRHWGGHKNDDPNYNLSNAHGVAVDLREPANPKLIVTCRNDNAFKYFPLDGKYIRAASLPGAFVCRPVLDDENLYAGVCWSVTREGQKWYPNTGFVTILDQKDKVLSNPGGEAPEYKDGELQPMFQATGAAKVFNHGHDVCVDEDKNVYVCQWNANKTPPVKLERV
ncbi:MAG TPA: 6-bladed beta-propeller [Flavilitoribacter sp.]|nr:6-bladed beta-propeller [Flavilitoribacter sp.]